MRKINWHGNDGRCFPAPGTVQTAECGVCGAKMNVSRNVLGPTGFAEAMAGRKHRHDSFVCPHIAEDWHKRICRLKMDVYLEECGGDVIGYEKMKKAAEKEIRKLLKANAAR